MSETRHYLYIAECRYQLQERPEAKQPASAHVDFTVLYDVKPNVREHTIKKKV